MRGIVLSLLLAIASCANQQIAYESELQAETKESLATVVIVRGFVDHEFTPEVFVDGDARCSLEVRTYCIVHLEPGSYAFAIERADLRGRLEPKRKLSPFHRKVQLDVAANKTNFIRIDSDVQYVIPVILPYVIGMVGKIKIFIAPMTSEDFFKMRSQIERIQPLPPATP